MIRDEKFIFDVLGSDIYSDIQAILGRSLQLSKKRNSTVYVHEVPKEFTGDIAKYYVGITSRDPNVRFGHNGKNYRGIHFRQAINKYGWENIKHRIICDELTRDDSFELEQKIISCLHSNEKQYGYNLTPGGDGGNAKAVTPVKQYDLYGNYIAEYPSASEASRVIGIDRSRISCSCKHGGLAKNFQWRYSSDPPPMEYRRKKQFPVVQLSLDGKCIRRYRAVADIFKHNPQFDKATIVDAINAYSYKTHRAYGFIWMYEHDQVVTA